MGVAPITRSVYGCATHTRREADRLVQIADPGVTCQRLGLRVRSSEWLDRTAWPLRVLRAPAARDADSRPRRCAARFSAARDSASIRGGPKTPSPASCIAPYPARCTRHGPSAKDPPRSRSGTRSDMSPPPSAERCSRVGGLIRCGQGWTCEPKPRSRRIDSRMMNALLAVKTSAAARMPVYLLMTGAAAWSATASR